MDANERAAAVRALVLGLNAELDRLLVPLAPGMTLADAVAWNVKVGLGCLAGAASESLATGTAAPIDGLTDLMSRWAAGRPDPDAPGRTIGQRLAERN